MAKKKNASTSSVAEVEKPSAVQNGTPMANPKKSAPPPAPASSGSGIGFQLFLFLLATVSIGLNVAIILGHVKIKGNF